MRDNDFDGSCQWSFVNMINAAVLFCLRKRSSGRNVLFFPSITIFCWLLSVKQDALMDLLDDVNFNKNHELNMVSWIELSDKVPAFSGL